MQHAHQQVPSPFPFFSLSLSLFLNVGSKGCHLIFIYADKCAVVQHAPWVMLFHADNQLPVYGVVAIRLI